MPMNPIGDYGLAFIQDVNCNDQHVTRITVDIHRVLNQIRHIVGWKVISDDLVLRRQIAIGSNGTLVYDGIYQRRRAAVKRLVKGLHDDSIEIKILKLKSHANVIPFYGKEEDDHFIYLVLQLCDFSLCDLVTSNKYPQLWSSSTEFPSIDLLKLMRGIVAGLVHLHSQEYLHGNLKPSNILIADLCPKLSGMGSCRLLNQVKMTPTHDYNTYHNPPSDDDYVVATVNSDWELHGGLLCRDFMCFSELGYGGWAAPEFLTQGLQTPAMDVFALGCVLFFCLTKGEHPFGYSELDTHVVNGVMPHFFALERIPEAVNLFSQMLHPDFKKRPKASYVLTHPMFWNPKTRMSFLEDVHLCQELNHRSFVFPESGWHSKMGDAFLKEMEQTYNYNYNYNYNLVTDLLRFVRDTIDSYHTLSKEVQEMLGAMPEGIDLFFRTRFPALLMEVYDVMYHHCKQEDWFKMYMDVGFLYGRDV